MRGPTREREDQIVDPTRMRSAARGCVALTQEPLRMRDLPREREEQTSCPSQQPFANAKNKTLQQSRRKICNTQKPRIGPLTTRNSPEALETSTKHANISHNIIQTCYNLRDTQKNIKTSNHHWIQAYEF